MQKVDILCRVQPKLSYTATEHGQHGPEFIVILTLDHVER